MAVYNGEKFIGSAIDSIINQTYKNFELIVVDDGSTDGTREILEHLVTSISNIRTDICVRLVFNIENIGLTKSLNVGLNAASGEYVARQDADDLSEPDRFSTQVDYLDKNPDIALVGSWYTAINEQGETVRCVESPTGHQEVAWGLIFYCPFSHSSVMFRKNIILNQLNGYDETFKYSQDYDLWSRLCFEYKIDVLPLYLVRIREVSNSMTNTMGDLVVDEPIKVTIMSINHYISDAELAQHTASQAHNLKSFWLAKPERFDSNASIQLDKIVTDMSHHFKLSRDISGNSKPKFDRYIKRNMCERISRCFGNSRYVNDMLTFGYITGLIRQFGLLRTTVVLIKALKSK